jgi:acetyltransferase-like isoleucine patch superfamily enzyme
MTAKKNYMQNIFSDFLAIVICPSPLIGAIFLSYFILSEIHNVYLYITLFAVSLMLSFIFFIFMWRLVLPPLQPGVFAVGINKGFIAWWTHSLLARSARMCGLQSMIHGIPVLRFLYWRALGAKVPYNINTSYSITIHDAALIEIGSGTMLAEDTVLSGHLVRGDKILVAKVKIGQNVFVGRNTYVGPRTRIGNSAWIGMGNHLSGNVIADNERVENFSKSIKN